MHLQIKDDILTTMLLKYIYTLFIGILFTGLVVAGIYAFYPRPEYPEYPEELTYPARDGKDIYESTESAEKYRQNEKEFREISQDYNRNVSIISLVAAVLALIISLTLIRNLQLISDGLLLGGVFTLLFSVGSGFESDDSKFRFIIILIGFIISLAVGYIKFVRPPEKSAPQS
jgi:hypothetical protein